MHRQCHMEWLLRMPPKQLEIRFYPLTVCQINTRLTSTQLHQVRSTTALLAILHALNSRMVVTSMGINALANKGVYTAYLCSAGKYSSASIPGLKKAREASASARAECWNVCVSECGEDAYICPITLPQSFSRGSEKKKSYVPRLIRPKR